ncbi:MAG: excisionase family DNA binding protein [Planctomycetota bacterium]|jgi:excisionase family DNA binding protein
MAKAKSFLSLEEVADLLGVNYQLIYRLVRKGELRAARLGRVYRVEQCDLDSYLERSKGHAAEPVDHVCSGCGRRYASRVSMKGECRECGADLCVECWVREERRVCREHKQD